MTIESLETLYEDEGFDLKIKTIKGYRDVLVTNWDLDDRTIEDKDFLIETLDTFCKIINDLQLERKRLVEKEEAEKQAKAAVLASLPLASQPSGSATSYGSAASQQTDANLEETEFQVQPALTGTDSTVPPANLETSSAQPTPPRPAATTERLTIKLNELVKKPETFDGRKPKPRKWIEDYKDAIDANTWSDKIAVKYFGTFLSDTAYAWFKTEVRPYLSINAKFDEIYEAFKLNYLGQSDYHSLSRQVEEMQQRANESISQFVPRMKELLLMLDPSMSDREQMRQISLKVRPEYRQWIAFSEPESVSELKVCCRKVEAGLPNNLPGGKDHDSSNTGNRKFGNKRGSSDRRNSNTTNNSSKPSNSQQPDNKSRKCYRCERMGHLSTECRARTKQDGKPVNDKVKNDKPANNSGQSKSSGTPNLRAGVLTVRRAVNAVFASTSIYNAAAPSQVSCQQNIPPVNLMVGGGRHIIQSVKCNNLKVAALVDTGAWVTVVSEETARKGKWKIGPLVQPLSGAGGEALDCIGSVQITIELTLGAFTKELLYTVAVVSNLAERMLIGLDLMDAMDIIIHVAQRRISFSPESVRPGVCLTNAEVVPPKSMKMVPVTVNTVGTIITTPSTFEDKVMVANSVSEVVANQSNALLFNYTSKPIEIPAGRQIATYEPHETPTNNSTVHAVLPIGCTAEIVNVGDELNDEQIEQLSSLLDDSQAAFSMEGIIGATDLVEHRIELLEGAKPFVEPLRRRPKAHVEETRRQVKSMLEQGILEESSSPWASAYVLAKKKNGELRLCVDFRKLNQLTKKTVYPLPNTDDCLETLAGKNYFTLIDFASGFWQIPVEESSRELTAFRTEDGQYQFKRMPFGLTNAPASFQRMINALLSGLKGLNLQVFIDDICLATETWSEHIALISQVLNLVIRSNLRLKGSKCTFGANQVVFLGHLISADGIRQDPSKLKALLSLPPPTDAHGVKRVLGMFSYYRKFVPSFALIAEPLTRLTRKDVEFAWSATEQSAFDQILKLLGQNAILKHFDHNDPIVVKTDASRQGVAGMLLQKSNGELKIVSCCSRRLSASEINYGVTDLEGLAVIYTLIKFRHYLLGKHFDLLVDHCPLCVLKDKMPTSARLRRWAIILSEYDYDIIYTRGDLHKDIDCLSRAPVDDPVDPYLENRIYSIAAPLHHDSWTAAYKDDESKDLLAKAEGKHEKLSLRRGVIYQDNKLYVPHSMRQIIIRDHHATPIAGHGGIEPTLRRMQDHVWWPTMRIDVAKYRVAHKTLYYRCSHDGTGL